MLKIGKYEFNSRFILGTGKYSVNIIADAIKEADVDLVTVALRRASKNNESDIFSSIPKNCKILLNTSGARTVDEAVKIASIAREGMNLDLIKIEVIDDSRYLLPNGTKTLETAVKLIESGFTVLPYIQPDLVLSRELEKAGCAAIMPLASPIGTNQGLKSRYFLELLVHEISVPVIVDAGISSPSDACACLEFGASAVLVNTAVSSSKNPVLMAKAFARAVKAGREAYLAGLGSKSDLAKASSPDLSFLQ